MNDLPASSRQATTDMEVEPAPGERWPNLTTVWDDALRAVVTTVTGPVDAASIARWAAGFEAAVDASAKAMPLRILVDVRGYAPDSIATHKAQRSAIITNPHVQASNTVVFIHHDVTKMEWLAKDPPPGVHFASELHAALKLLRHET